MKLLVDAGDFEILAKPANAAEIIKKAGCTCYQSEDSTTKSPEEFARMLRKLGHWSMFDHVYASVKIKNCSRAVTHELVRHRLCAFAQESTRYVEQDNLHVIGPGHRDLNEKFYVPDDPKRHDAYSLSFEDMAETVEHFYKTLLSAGWTKEDARLILPIGTKSEIVMTADFTEWRHVFRLRTQKAAYWEIRVVMVKLLEEFKKLFPYAFDDFVLAGYDEYGYPYYKIKGFVNNIKELIRRGIKSYKGEVDKDAITSHIEDFYENNY